MTEPIDERTIEELTAELVETNKRLEAKAQVLTNLGMEVPGMLLTKLRIEYWIGAIAETMDDGERWMAQHELKWAESIAVLLDEGIRQAAADDVDDALHLPGLNGQFAPQ